MCNGTWLLWLGLLPVLQCNGLPSSVDSLSKWSLTWNSGYYVVVASMLYMDP